MLGLPPTIHFGYFLEDGTGWEWIADINKATRFQTRSEAEIRIYERGFTNTSVATITVKEENNEDKFLIPQQGRQIRL